MYRFAKITIYLEFAFTVTIFDIFKLIIKLIIKFDDRPFETGGHFEVLQRYTFTHNILLLRTEKVDCTCNYLPSALT